MTLLETIWNETGTEAEVIEATATALESGELKLSGNFRGLENSTDWRADHTPNAIEAN